MLLWFTRVVLESFASDISARVVVICYLTECTTAIEANQPNGFKQHKSCTAPFVELSRKLQKQQQS